MATRVNATAEYYLRTASLPSIATFTLSCYVRLVTQASLANQVSPLFYRNDGAGDAAWAGVYLRWLLASNDTRISMDATATAQTDGTILTIGSWYHVGFTRSGNVYTTYLNGVQDIQFTDASAMTNTRMYIAGNDFTGGTYPSFDVAAVKIWDGVALTASELLTESRQVSPFRVNNLHSFYPLLSIAEDETDYYTGGLTATVSGTFTTSPDGPPIPWQIYRNRADPYQVPVARRFILGTH